MSVRHPALLLPCLLLPCHGYPDGPALALALGPAPCLQTGIPDADSFGHHDVVGVVEAGWRQQVFGRIRQIFGYGC